MPRRSLSELDRLMGDEGALLMLYEADRSRGTEKLVPRQYITTALSYLEKRGQKDKLRPESKQDTRSTKPSMLPIASVAASSPKKRLTPPRKGVESKKKKLAVESHVNGKRKKSPGKKATAELPSGKAKPKSGTVKAKPAQKTKNTPLKSGTPGRGKTPVKTPLRKVQGTPGKIVKKGKEKPKIVKVLKAFKSKEKKKITGSSAKSQTKKEKVPASNGSAKAPKRAKVVSKAVKVLRQSKAIRKPKEMIKKTRVRKGQKSAKAENEANENNLVKVQETEPFDPDTAFSYVFEPRPSKNPAEMSRIIRRRSWSSESSGSDLESEDQTRADIQSAANSGADHEEVPDISSSLTSEEPPFPIIKRASKKRGNTSVDSEAGSETGSLRSESSVSSSRMTNNMSDLPSPRKKGPSILAPISFDGGLELSPPLSADNNSSGCGASTDTSSNLPTTVQNSTRSGGQRSSLRQAEAHYHYKELTLKKLGHVTQIIFNPVSTKLKNAFNVSVLKEFRQVLLSLRKDKHCKVVLVTSVHRMFCQGVDLSYLVHSAPDRCKKAAKEMTEAIKYFIWTLAHFPKPIVAGVEGRCIGLGAAMLPLFDLVYASDSATFCMPYGKLGQVPEGAVSLSFPVVFGNSLTCSLLYGSRRLTATEAQNCGLVTGVLWPDRFLEELIPMVQALAGHASQGMESTKALLRQQVRAKLAVTLENESTLLVHHWSSQEGQRLIKQYLTSEEVVFQ